MNEQKRMVITGYTNNITCNKSFDNINSSWIDVLCKARTNAEDHNGFKGMETLEILKDSNFKDEFIIVRGSDQEYDQFSSSDSYNGLFMSCDKPSLISALRELADKLELCNE